MRKYILTFFILFGLSFTPLVQAKELPLKQYLFVLPYQNRYPFTEKFKDKNFLFWRFSNQKWGYAERSHFFHNIPSMKMKEKKRLSPLQEGIMDIFFNPNYPPLGAYP